MFLMHTKLTDFLKKMKYAAAHGGKSPKPIDIKGLESMHYAKMQSLRTGRIEQAVEELARRDDVDHIELTIRPRVPETENTAIVKAYDKDGKAVKAILESLVILHGTEDLDTYDCPEVEDRRARLGQQS